MAYWTMIALTASAWSGGNCLRRRFPLRHRAGRNDDERCKEFASACLGVIVKGSSSPGCGELVSPPNSQQFSPAHAGRVFRMAMLDLSRPFKVWALRRRGRGARDSSSLSEGFSDWKSGSGVGDLLASKQARWPNEFSPLRRLTKCFISAREPSPLQHFLCNPGDHFTLRLLFPGIFLIFRIGIAIAIERGLAVVPTVREMDSLQHDERYWVTWSHTPGSVGHVGAHAGAGMTSLCAHRTSIRAEAVADALVR